MSRSVLMLPGDGIGPEIVAEAEKVLKKINEQFQLASRCPAKHWIVQKNPMPFCWGLWVAPNGTSWRWQSDPRRACWACART